MKELRSPSITLNGYLYGIASRINTVDDDHFPVVTFHLESAQVSSGPSCGFAQWHIAGYNHPVESLGSMQDTMQIKGHLDESGKGNVLAAKEFRRMACRRMELSSPRRIAIAGVPTRGRLAELRRLLTGFERQLRQSNREAIPFLIADDSTSQTVQAQTRSMLSSPAVYSKLLLRYSSRAMRARFADELARAAEIDAEIARFALLGDSRFYPLTGGARNALLLASVGNCFLGLDDDVECSLTGSPDCRDSTAIAPRADCFEFLHGYEDIEQRPVTGENLIELHEQMLGIEFPGGEGLSFDDRLRGQQIPRMLRMPFANPWSVRVSLMGVLGDCGLNHPLPYYRQRGLAMRRFAASETAYRHAAQTRVVLRIPFQRYVYDRMSCMTYCFAFDNREMMPPFLPVLRAQEMVWAALLRSAVPGTLFGAIPRAIVHRPPVLQTFRDNEAILHAGRLSTGEAISALILAQNVEGSSAPERLECLGTALFKISSGSDAQFARVTRDVWRRSARRSFKKLQRRLNEYPEGPLSWRQDMERLKAEFMEAARRPTMEPPDLVTLFGNGTQTQFRELVKRFSRLLLAWPKIVVASRHLLENGTSPFAPLDC